MVYVFTVMMLICGIHTAFPDCQKGVTAYDTIPGPTFNNEIGCNGYVLFDAPRALSSHGAPLAPRTGVEYVKMVCERVPAAPAKIVGDNAQIPR